MDFGTGTAGVLFALASAQHDQPPVLPFLAPLPGAHRLPRDSGGDLIGERKEGR